jgi:DNA processing protein
MSARAFDTPISARERFMQMTVSEALGTLTDVEEKNAPKTLYFQGNRELLNHGPRVSVVGSRKASEEGLKRARSLARALVAHDIVVVSGLAEGIDTAAHTSALDAGGKTFAVIGTPLDTYYPKENQALQQRLELEQLVISQFPIGSAVTPKNFPIRNRTMALLTDATVIVEAG